MGENEEIQSPIELLRLLIEKSGKWTEESVVYVRLILLYLVMFFTLFLYFMYLWIRDSLSRGNTILIPIVPTILITIINVWVLVKVRRRYRSHVDRRDNWRRKFEVLKRKEGEIERLLSEEAG
jgi:hypothetical protein